MTKMQPPSVLLMGPPGSGKTYSVPTLIEAGLEVFVLMTEPNGVDSLVDSVVRRQLPMDRLHWHLVPPVTPGWSGLRKMATTVQNMSFAQIQDIKSGVGKNEQQQLLAFLDACSDFPDDRTGEHFGDVTEWDASRAFVIDSLSGLNRIAMDHTIGLKPTAHQGEWGIAMNLEETLILKLTSDIKSFFVLIAHIDKELDEITGVRNVVAAALGRKVGPKLGRMFSEVVLSRRDGKGFHWATTDDDADLKNRALPVGRDLPPNFRTIVDAYRSRLEAAKAA